MNENNQLWYYNFAGADLAFKKKKNKTKKKQIENEGKRVFRPVTSSDRGGVPSIQIRQPACVVVVGGGGGGWGRVEQGGVRNVVAEIFCSERRAPPSKRCHLRRRFQRLGVIYIYSRKRR